jgi:hypothetical protein
MKKKLDTTGVMNELRGQSVFFPTKADKSTPEHSAEPIEQTRNEEPLSSSSTPLSQETTHDTVIPRYHETMNDTMIPSNHDAMVPKKEDEVLETVRKAVKQLGREPATQRLTIEEKQALRDIEYTYSSQSIQTSSNEIIRISLNFVLADYRLNGENSILAKVLRKLNS